GPVLGNEGTVPVCTGKLRRLVKGALQRRRVRGEQHVRHEGARYSLRWLRLDSLVGMRADVRKREAIEAAVANFGEVVRRQIVAEPSAFVDVGPQMARRRINGNADGIAKTARIDTARTFVRIAREDDRTGGVILE